MRAEDLLAVSREEVRLLFIGVSLGVSCREHISSIILNCCTTLCPRSTVKLSRYTYYVKNITVNLNIYSAGSYQSQVRLYAK